MGAIKTFFERVKFSNTLKSSSQFLEDRDLHRLPMVYGTNQYFLTRDDMWVGFHIPHKNFGFLSFRRRQDYFTEALNWFTNFPAREENAGHILVVNHVQTAKEWEEKLISEQKELADAEGRVIPFGLVPYIRLSREAIDKQEFFRRDVYLFVKTNERSTFKSGIRGILETVGRQLTSGFGIDESMPLSDEKKENAERARDLIASMRGGWINPQPLRRSKVEWIIRYIDSLGQPTPDNAPEDAQEWSIGQWQTTMASWTREVDLGKNASGDRIKAIEFITTTGEGKGYACFMPIEATPAQVSPFSNWLFNASTLRFPVDISLHFEVIDPIRAERELDRPINMAKAQQMEEREADREPDETTVLQRTALERVKTEAITNRKPMVVWQCVFAVYDSNPDALKEKVAELKTHYDHMQMKLTVPPFDQRPLFYQSFPGSTLLVKDWLQRTSPNFVAAAMPWLNTNVGSSLQHPAFYQGYVIADGGSAAKAISPVFFDLVSIADRLDRAPTEFVCGDPGSGKTVSRGLKAAHENALKGITQFIWDPKGDFLPLSENARELLLDEDKVQTIQLGRGSKDSISLDAFAIAEYDEENEIDDREVTAQDVLFGLVRGMKHSPESLGSMIPSLVSYVVEQAAATSRHTGTVVQPKMKDIFPVLTQWSEGNIPLKRITEDMRKQYRHGADVLLKHLLTVRKSSLGKILFADPDLGSLTIRKGSTIIFNAINLKEINPDSHEGEGVEDAVSRVIQEMMTSYIRSLLYKLDPIVTKAVFFDEWHVIRRSPSAERLLDWLKRMGRSRRTAVTYLSQSADDAGQGILNSIWAGKCETEHNARASCRLLQIEETDENVKTLTGLGKGQFIYRDHEGNVALVQVDFWDADVLALFNTQASAKAAKQAKQRKLAEEAEAAENQLVSS